MKVAQTVVAMILGIVLPLLVQLWDARRLPEAVRARSWNVASWGSALYAFGPLSMLGWSFVTRRGWSRFVAGPLWMAAIVVTMSLVDHGLALLGGGEVEGTLLELVTAVPFVVVGGVIIELLAALISWRVRVWKRRIARARRWLAREGSPA